MDLYEDLFFFPLSLKILLSDMTAPRWLSCKYMNCMHFASTRVHPSCFVGSDYVAYLLVFCIVFVVAVLILCLVSMLPVSLGCLYIYNCLKKTTPNNTSPGYLNSAIICMYFHLYLSNVCYVYLKFVYRRMDLIENNVLKIFEILLLRSARHNFIIQTLRC